MIIFYLSQWILSSQRTRVKGYFVVFQCHLYNISQRWKMKKVRMQLRKKCFTQWQLILATQQPFFVRKDPHGISTPTHLPWDHMCVQQWARQAGLWQVSTNPWASSVSNVILSIGQQRIHSVPAWQDIDWQQKPCIPEYMAKWFCTLILNVTFQPQGLHDCKQKVNKNSFFSCTFRPPKYASQLIKKVLPKFLPSFQWQKYS